MLTFAIAAATVVSGLSGDHASIDVAARLFAGLFLGHLLAGGNPTAALDAALADLDRVLAASMHQAVLNLAALGGDSAGTA